MIMVTSTNLRYDLNHGLLTLLDLHSSVPISFSINCQSESWQKRSGGWPDFFEFWSKNCRFLWIFNV